LEKKKKIGNNRSFSYKQLALGELGSATGGLQTVLGDLSPKTLDFTGFLEVVPIGCPVI